MYQFHWMKKIFRRLAKHTSGARVGHGGMGFGIMHGLLVLTVLHCFYAILPGQQDASALKPADYGQNHPQIMSKLNLSCFKL